MPDTVALFAGIVTVVDGLTVASALAVAKENIASPPSSNDPARAARRPRRKPIRILAPISECIAGLT